MRRFERGEAILEILKEKGNASIVFLAKTLNISESSVRRDINYMTSLPSYRNVHRVRGGIYIDTKRSEFEYMFELKVNLDRELKKAIARKAIEHVEDGDSILIDSGTTCLYFAQLLGNKRHLKVITLDIKIAEELGKYVEMESCVIGGVIRPGYYTIGGSNALDNLDRFSGYKVFMSADAVDFSGGLSNTSEFEVGAKKKIIENGKQVFLMVDCTKFKKKALYRLAELSQIDTIITNQELEADTLRQLNELGCTVILA
jgi:DeoR/GlpR family transcriptional regulator of sugar metabolism